MLSDWNQSDEFFSNFHERSIPSRTHDVDILIIPEKVCANAQIFRHSALWFFPVILRSDTLSFLFLKFLQKPII